MIAAIVLAKPANLAKGRLAPVLSPADREALARGLLRQVVEVLRRTCSVDSIYLVGAAEPELPVVLVPDPGLGMNAAANAGLTAANRDGATAALVLPADLPLLTVAAVERLLEPLQGAGRHVAIIAPDRRREGTNALLLAPPTLFNPSFGFESFARHRSLAADAGATAYVHDDAAIATDLDTPADLAALPAAVLLNLLTLGAGSRQPTLRRG